MDENKFANGMTHLAMAYNQRDLLEEQALNVWYHYLGSFSAEAFAAVVSEYILHESKAPSISDLVYKCKDKDRKLRKEVERRIEEEAEEVGDDWNV